MKKTKIVPILFGGVLYWAIYQKNWLLWAFVSYERDEQRAENIAKHLSRPDKIFTNAGTT